MKFLRCGARHLSARQLAQCLFACTVIAVHSIPISAQSRANNARLAGAVVEASSGVAVWGVLVEVVGANRRAITKDHGEYFIDDVPPGTWRVQASKAGFAPSVIDYVVHSNDQPAVVNFSISTIGFRTGALSEAATLQPLPVNNAPFVVDVVSAKEMPMPTANVAEMLSGKVAGVQLTRASGAPAADVAIQLRALTSLYRAGAPLLIVDNVVLNETFAASAQDIEAMDIESIEVLKGGTAAALYGARAIDGAIAIKTHRGRAARLNRPQFTLRTESGRDFAGDWVNERNAHPYRVNANGLYVNESGGVVTRTQRVLQANGIAENPYAEPTYEHGKQFFRPGFVNNQTLSIQQNASSTNFNVSYSRSRQPGLVENADGYTRQSARVNLDQRVGTRLQIGLSAARTRADEEPAAFLTSDLLRLEPDVNLRAPDVTGRFPYIIFPDSLDRTLNPLVQQLASSDRVRRSRTLVSGVASYRVLSWLSINALASTDRGTRRERTDAYSLVNPTTVAAFRTQNDTALSERYQYGANVQHTFGRFSGRVALRGESQYSRNTLNELVATNLNDSGVPVTSSTYAATQTEGLTATVGNANVAYAGKYAVDIVARRERNSIYGGTLKAPTYLRAGAAWILSDESWFSTKKLSLFKLRYSIGVAKTEPPPVVVYVPIGTSISIPNNDSRAEQEIGADLIFGRRVSTSLTYAPFSAKGNVLAMYTLGTQSAAPANGHLTGNSIEATVQARLAESAYAWQWSMALTASRVRAEIAEFPQTCFSTGIQRFCGATSIDEMWGNRLVTNKDQLRAVHANSQAAFDINDDGFVVPVGAGNSWRDGKAKSLWGTTINIDGRSYPWGLPIVATDTDGGTQYGVIGNGFADMRYGLQNNMQYKGVRLYAQFTGQVGGQTYNNAKQILYANGLHADVGQTNKPNEQRKPVAYYRAVADGNSGYLRNFVESATSLRLAELSAGYTLSANRFAFLRSIGADRIGVELVGRNVLNLGGVSGIPANLTFGNYISNVDYPLARTFTLATTISF